MREEFFTNGCLNCLSVRRIIRHIDDDNFGIYSADRDRERSSDHDHAIEGSERFAKFVSRHQ